MVGIMTGKGGIIDEKVGIMTEKVGIMTDKVGIRVPAAISVRITAVLRHISI
jgi:hypothetical protein